MSHDRHYTEKRDCITLPLRAENTSAPSPFLDPQTFDEITCLDREKSSICSKGANTKPVPLNEPPTLSEKRIYHHPEILIHQTIGE